MVKMYSGNDEEFLTACRKAEITATHRQWRKWCNKKGSARKLRNTD